MEIVKIIYKANYKSLFPIKNKVPFEGKLE